MIIALDANILLRFFDTSADQHPVTIAALAVLRTQGHSLAIIPQSLYEFWVVATRPIVNNGLGQSAAECDRAVEGILATFPLKDDTSGIFTEWRKLVSAHDCHGKIAHDARIVAALRIHALTHLLTFNVGDFARFPGLTILDPKVIAAGFTGP